MKQIEFVMPDRKTIMLETFQQVTIPEQIAKGQQFIATNVKDNKLLIPILLTCKGHNGYHILSEGMGGVFYDLCYVFSEPETKY